MNIMKYLSLGMCAMLLAACTTQNGKHAVEEVEAVVADCPEGTAPRLPYRLWVKYSDGTAEYRQVKWSNFAPAAEMEEADAAQHPAGTSYTVKGFLIGDNTTADGFPVTAQVNVVGGTYHTPVQPIAHTVPLTDVTVDGDNRLTSNRDLALREICSWDVTQQLYNYRDTYGLPTKGYTRSDGWDSPDTKLKGHGSGHYMSALALGYAVATDPAQKEILRKNITRMVNELRECQERTFVWNEKLGRYWEARDFAPEEELRTMKGTWAAFDEHKKHWDKYGYGYLNAIPAQHAALIEMYRPYNNSDWVWAPYYSIHKQLAGLIDIATYFDDKEIADKALLIAKDMGLWVWNRMHYRTYVKEDGTQEERRAVPGNRYEMWNMYIAGEVGGISESLARLSEMVSDADEKAKLLEASNCFDSPALFKPLSRNIDDIRTRHANQHIPMIVGALRSYLGNHDPYYYNLSENFWTLVQGRYRYATGGVGNGEMFRQPYSQMMSMVTNGMREGESYANPDLNETCCAYNLLKLSKDLNCYNPDDARYMDYYERTLYNQLVGSIHPEHYMMTYHYGLGLNATKPFGNRTPQESCCGGTGSENHVKYQEATYFVNENTLWVALYMPTTLNWKEKGVVVKQECLWPAESSKIIVTEGEATFAMKLRVPYWATAGFSVKVNGKAVKASKPGTYTVLEERTWKTGDVVEVEMSFTKHIDFGPDKLPAEMTDGVDDDWLGALMYGPLVMTATDVTSWDEATLSVDASLKSVSTNPVEEPRTGTLGNVYSLVADGKTFLPDYYRHENTTHYFRIFQKGKERTAKVDAEAGEVDKSNLLDLLNMANERRDAQVAWEALEVKVPEYAPWAANGYSRLLEALDKAQAVYDNAEVTQRQVNASVSALNRALNSMRPGNLPEPEDLRQLSGLLRRAGNISETTSAELKEAIEYGEMVMSYVADGSGTFDMIDLAVKRLRTAIEK